MSVALDRALDPPAPGLRADLEVRLRQTAEGIAIPVLALLASAAIFSLFLLLQGKSPAQFFTLMYMGGFGSSFSLQNSLQRATPLLLTALCVAIPARLGLVVIGGEGALVLGGLMAAAVAVPLLGLPAPVVWLAMALAGALGGAVCIGLVGALRHYRGVNETISSLLVAYIAIAIMNQMVEGPLRDPASLNKPSTLPIGDAYMLPFGRAAVTMSGDDVTVVTWGAMVERAEHAAAQIEREDGCSAEVIDLRTLMPWDRETVLASVARTRRCLVVHEDLHTAGFGAEVAATVSEQAFLHLDAPVSRLTMPDVPSPHNAVLLDAVVPSVARIRAAITSLLQF